MSNERSETAIGPNAAIRWLEEAAKYFAHRDTRGEDAAYWANVYNSETCRKIATLIRESLR